MDIEELNNLISLAVEAKIRDMRTQVMHMVNFISVLEKNDNDRLTWEQNVRKDRSVLRDHFACAALTGLLAKGAPNKSWNEADLAFLSFKIADVAMIEREKK